MHRVQVFPGAIPLETDILNTNKNTMVALAKLSAAALGTSTIANGLACVPTGPASLQVVVNPGEIYSLQNVDGTAYSSLAADTTHQIVKQGILLDAATLNCPAPGAGGQSINYLIQAAYQDLDALPVVLPYYNASNPATAYSGPANAGTTNNTVRQGNCVVSAKAGAAAATGSQTTPAADAGYIGLWVVTVANGQATIVAGNIVAAANQSILPGSLLASLQGNLTTYAADTGAANAYVVAYTPAVAALTDGMVLWFKAKTANTGASTVAVNGIAAVPLVGSAQSALQGGEIVANGRCMAIYNATINSCVLIECTGAAVQVGPATQSGHALQLGQATGRLLAVRVLGSGVYTPTAGTTSVIVEVQGAGGGGGGSAATGAGQLAAGSGGFSGAYGKGRLTAGFAGVTVTVGAVGAAGAIGASGGAGGTSSFGALVSAPGGPGGIGGAALTPPGMTPPGSGIVVATGGNLVLSQSAPSTPGLLLSTSYGLAGSGGNSVFGGGYPGSSAPGPGQACSSVGGGGSGGLTGASSAGNVGGVGGLGTVIVYEFA